MQEHAISAAGYRARAKQLRAEAEAKNNPEARKALIDIAAHYDRLADHVLQSKLRDDSVG
jgi:hypothetical protein